MGMGAFVFELSRDALTILQGICTCLGTVGLDSPPRAGENASPGVVGAILAVSLFGIFPLFPPAAEATGLLERCRHRDNTLNLPAVIMPDFLNPFR